MLSCSAPTFVGGPIPPDTLKDGTYDGEAKDGPVKVLVQITIKDQQIAKVDLLRHRTWKGKAAESIIPDRIIDEQSTKVDVVSGATVSSRAIMNAVEAAVKKAY